MTVANSLTKKPQFQVVIKSEAVQKNIMSTLGSATRAKSFTASIISAVSTNPDLQQCDAYTIISAALLGESLKLSPSPQLGQYYMVPFANKNKPFPDAQFILGYKGYIQLAIRSGQYKRINVLAIKKDELISYNPLDEEINVNLIDDEVERENAETIGYYAMFELVNGFKKSLYWSKGKMESHALTYSKGYRAKTGYTFWEKSFDDMAYKTMLRQLLSRWGVLSIEMQKALEADMSVIEEDGSYKYVDNENDLITPDTPPSVPVQNNIVAEEKPIEQVDDFFAGASW
jgi:recombination protein RecT